MKNLSEGNAAAPAPAPAPDEFVSRKLIRPTLGPPNRATQAAHEARSDRAPRAPRPASTEQTFAEVFYYQKQIQSKTLLTVVLRNGETVEGTLEWYDRTCIRVTRRDQSSLMIYKSAIKYMYKSGENQGR
jgi:host factor-I protein